MRNPPSLCPSRKEKKRNHPFFFSASLFFLHNLYFSSFFLPLYLLFIHLGVNCSLLSLSFC
jgi:hypothetical protein